MITRKRNNRVYKNSQQTLPCPFLIQDKPNPRLAIKIEFQEPILVLFWAVRAYTRHRKTGHADQKTLLWISDSPRSCFTSRSHDAGPFRRRPLVNFDLAAWWRDSLVNDFTCVLGRWSVLKCPWSLWRFDGGISMEIKLLRLVVASFSPEFMTKEWGLFRAHKMKNFS